jgi:Flp pilus assembly protein TadB
VLVTIPAYCQDEPVRELLLLVHTGGAALWLGSMAYSLFLVQPRLPRMLGDEAAVEDAQRVLAHGNRWPVVAIISALWLTGAGLVLTGDGAGWWWAGVGLKAVLLAAATGLFWWVSWRGWPRRVFALPSELPGLQRRFRLVAITMFGLVGAAFAAGTLLTAGP